MGGVDGDVAKEEEGVEEEVAKGLMKKTSAEGEAEEGRVDSRRR